MEGWLLFGGFHNLLFSEKGWNIWQVSYIFLRGGGGYVIVRGYCKVMQFLLENGLFGRVAHTYSTLPQEVVRSFCKLLT
jgi:hypothetical protein